MGAPAGVQDVRGLAPPVSGERPRLHHRQRLQPAAHAAELPEAGRAGRSGFRVEPVRCPPRDHGDRADGQPHGGREAAPRAARVRREDLSGRLRVRLLVAESPAPAPGRRAQDRPLVRQEPAASRSSGDCREHPRAGPDAQDERGRRGHRAGRAGARARAPWVHPRPGLSLLAPAFDAGRRGAPRGQPLACAAEGPAIRRSG